VAAGRVNRTGKGERSGRVNTDFGDIAWNHNTMQLYR
jgi:hypothetical protein